MQLKKHNISPQIQDAMPPHGHGVKDNEINPVTNLQWIKSGFANAPFGVWRWIKMTGNSANTDLIGQASDESNLLQGLLFSGDANEVFHQFPHWDAVQVGLVVHVLDLRLRADLPLAVGSVAIAVHAA